MQNTTKFKVAAKYGTSFNGSGNELQTCGAVTQRDVQEKKRWQIKLYETPKFSAGNTPSQDGQNEAAPIEARFLKINFVQAAEDIHGLKEHDHSRDGQKTTRTVKKSVEIRFDTIPHAVNAQKELAAMSDDDLKAAILQENLADILADKLGLNTAPIKDIKQPPRVAIFPPHFMAS